MSHTIELMVTADDIKQAFARRLNEALDDARFPPKGAGRQVAAGERYGVSQKGAGKWLEGDGMPETTKAIEIATDLGVSFEWLMTGRGDKKVPPYPERSDSPQPGAEEERASYDAIKHDTTLIRELLAGLLGPLGLRLESIDIDCVRGLSLHAAWGGPPIEHRRGLHAVSGDPAPEAPELPGELKRPTRGVRKKRAS